jgi:hypothetical protein
MIKLIQLIFMIKKLEKIQFHSLAAKLLNYCSKINCMGLSAE